jgi:type II secretion system protein H
MAAWEAMMILPTGPRNKAQCAFTLIELILVMTIIVIMTAVTFPMLRAFFQNRSLESEARRFLSLTRFAQNRAVSEGIPMIVWVDAQKSRYGVEAEKGFLDQDDKAVEYEADEKLTLEVAASSQNRNALTQEQQLRRRTSLRNTRPEIKFLPDGSVDLLSLESVAIRRGKDFTLWVNQSDNHLNYEVDDQPLQRRR